MKVFRISFLGYFLVLCLIFQVKAQPNIRSIYRNIREMAFSIIGRSINEPRLLQRADSQHRIQKRMPSNVEFPCRQSNNDQNLFKSVKNSRMLPWSEVRSKTRPTSVHALRPGDIDVVGAMGDSLTAANGAGASNVFQVFIENRGVSWSIGGQNTWREYCTLPNILKEFNPKLIGYSLADGLGHQSVTQFNAAEIGAMSRDLPHMARELVRRMKNDPRVDINNDWKLITIMIGANDFCVDVCYQRNPMKAVDNHVQELRTALRTLRDNLPRTLVNVVPGPNVETIKRFSNKPPVCQILHLVNCPCFMGEAHRHMWPMMRDIIKKWQQVDATIDQAPEFNTKEDFAVVVQPFDLDIKFPTDKNGNTDYSYLSTDCFHFSQKGYAIAANALWNNMMEPVGNKSMNWKDIYDTVLCPTIDHPYIYTRNNSFTSINNQIYKNNNNNERRYLENNLVKRNIYG
ncbi:phospholipase B1, membrane-associated-like [Arctopsyche grandis]|uniref:phospholipase B1, membrane-associated-like n=1 Tax=Arctopsyche grandis TaxID=121162 RepID=UPI00406D90B3